MPPRRKATNLDEPLNLPPPAPTIEGRNDQLIAAAFDLVERRLHDGSASAQETVHFLRMGTVNQRLQEEKVRRENLVLEARVEELKSRNSGEEMMAKALAAFRGYSGQEPVDPEAEDEDENLYGAFETR